MQPENVIAHVDMDAFFASVEIRDNPALAGKPVLVGGTGRRGVVAAASYEARKFGCRSAQPTAVALRHCPHAIVLPGRHTRYQAVSREVFKIFARFSPIVEGLSIDEAFLDLSGTQKLLGPPLQVAEQLRATVREQTGLTCSVGISRRKFIAKIASAACKPDGLLEIPAGEEQAFLDPLPIAKLWGVGPKAQNQLRTRGIATVGQLRACSPEKLWDMFGKHGGHLARLAAGIDDREVTPHREAKSIGHEDTFAHDLRTRKQVCQQLLAQATKVADRLVAREMAGRRVSIKIRDQNFRTRTRQCTLPQATNQAREIYAAATSLFAELDLRGLGVRLTGVSVSMFTPTDHPDHNGQLSLGLDAPTSKPAEQTGQKLQDVLSEVRRKFGTKALYPAGVDKSKGA